MRHGRPGKIKDIKMPKLPEFLRNRSRVFLTVAGSIIFVALAGGIYGIILLSSHTASGISAAGPETTPDTNQDIPDVAEVLPQQIRAGENSEANSWSAFSAISDPFAGPMKLTGVVIGGIGGPMAIVESSGTAFIVFEGDYVDDLWAVNRITREMVILRSHNQEVSLYFDQPPSMRSLDYEGETEEDASGEGV
jgi:hypothetical protein